MLVLSRDDVLATLTLPDCIERVEAAFRLHAEGRTLGPGVLSVAASGGGFHVKVAGLVGERSYVAAKTNGNFPDNPGRLGLPAIQGTVVLADASNGVPLAVMESSSITALRTGSATAVAAKLLARKDARTAAIVGCGVQGAIQLQALAAVMALDHVRLVDADPNRARAMAAQAESTLGLRVSVLGDVRAAVRTSDVCVTCTPSRRPLIFAGDVAPGTFIAAVGADSQGKQELDPALVSRATLVVDVLEQCAEIGELQHALAAGLMGPDDVHAELAQVVAGQRPGRTREDEITIFDSTGTALQDVAAAIAVYERARAIGRGVDVAWGG